MSLESPQYYVVLPGEITFSTPDICKSSQSEREIVVASIEAVLKEVACDSYDVCYVTVLSFCGDLQNQAKMLSLSSRRLEIAATVQFEVVILKTCNTSNCMDEQKSILNINEEIAETGLASIQSGQYITDLSKNIISGTMKSLLACAVTWGVIGGASIANFTDNLTSSNTSSASPDIIDPLFYPVSHAILLPLSF